MQVLIWKQGTGLGHLRAQLVKDHIRIFNADHEGGI